MLSEAKYLRNELLRDSSVATLPQNDKGGGLE